MPFLRQLRHKVTQAAVCPQQRPHRVAPRRRRYQALEIGHKRWILACLLLTPATLLADPSGRRRNGVDDVGASVINRRSRQPTDLGHQTDTATSQCLRFQRHKAPSALLIQNRCHLPIAFACGARLCRPNHSAMLRPANPPWESSKSYSSRTVAIPTQLFMDEPLACRGAGSPPPLP